MSNELWKCWKTHRECFGKKERIFQKNQNVRLPGEQQKRFFFFKPKRFNVLFDDGFAWRFIEYDKENWNVNMNESYAKMYKMWQEWRMGANELKTCQQLCIFFALNVWPKSFWLIHVHRMEEYFSFILIFFFSFVCECAFAIGMKWKYVFVCCMFCTKHGTMH